MRVRDRGFSQAAVLPEAAAVLDPQEIWASKREAELRSQRKPEWQHNESVLGDFDPETVEERIARMARENLLESFERVPGLRVLYSTDPETGAELLDPEKCQAAGEPVVNRTLAALIVARLDQAQDQDMVCQGSKTGIGIHLCAERPPERRLCLAYSEPEYSQREGIDIVSKRALLLDPESGRFVCQEISRPWTDVGRSREKVEDGVMRDDVERVESPSSLLDVISAISLLAEARTVKKHAPGGED